MKYKVVKGSLFCEYHVMYKKNWYSRWKYCRRKKQPTLIWTWNTYKGAQAFINLQNKKA